MEYLLKDKITDFIHRKVKDEVSDPQYDEVVEHLRFCQNKCSTFHGRKEILDQCRAYLKVINKFSSFKVGTSKSDSIIQISVFHSFFLWRNHCDMSFRCPRLFTLFQGFFPGYSGFRILETKNMTFDHDLQFAR